jgi:hypothetical protein
MMKLICVAVGIGAIVTVIVIAPDIARYLRIRSM